MVAYTLRFEVPFSTQPHPAGLAHFIDLTWLSDPLNFSVYRSAIYVLLLLYVGGLMLAVVLPALALGHVLVFTLYNSQGYTHHGFQIVSLTLVAQAATVFYYTVLKGFRVRPPDARLNAWLLTQSQVIVVGTYLVSVCTKMITTRGLWVWNANYIAADLIKSRRQLYFGDLDPKYQGNSRRSNLAARAPVVCPRPLWQRPNSGGNRISCTCQQENWLCDWNRTHSHASEHCEAHGSEIR